MRTTDAMREVLARPIAKVPALRGRNVTILFYEASTRTRVSFEVAAKNLSADVVNIAAAASSVSKGESLVDTVRTVEALGAQMLVMRHACPGRRTSPPRSSAARCSTAATAGTPTRPRRCSTCTRCASHFGRRVAGGPQGRDPRRRPAFAGRALEHLVADRGRRGPVAVRAGDAAARLRGVGGPRRGGRAAAST